MQISLIITVTPLDSWYLFTNLRHWSLINVQAAFSYGAWRKIKARELKQQKQSLSQPQAYHGEKMSNTAVH